MKDEKKVLKVGSHTITDNGNGTTTWSWTSKAKSQIRND